MSTTFTFDLLNSSVAAYFSRNDAAFLANIPLAIALGQHRLARDLEVLGTEKVITDTFNGDALTSGIVAKPADWLEPCEFMVGTNLTGATGYNTTQSVKFRRYSYLRSIYPNSKVSGTPRFYADYDYWNWLVMPLPDQAYPFEVRYRAIPVMLDAGNQQNFFTRRVPDVLLYACLLEQALFVKNQDMIAELEGMYAERMNSVDKQALRNMSDNQESAKEA